MNDIGNRFMLNKSVEFVSIFYSEKLPEWAVYHNLQHTIETVDACKEIGKNSNLSDDDLEILCIAAWFHDIGYVFKAEEHEEKSSEIAGKFLKDNGYPLGKINKVIDCIMATKILYLPQDLMEFIIRDSDLISLGRIDYFKKNDLLKLEIELRDKKKISEISWLKRSVRFLSSHNFFTEYATLNFQSQHEANLLTLQKKLKDLISKNMVY